MEAGKVLHKGGCHCGLVRWQARASPEVVAWDCNCSICKMRRNPQFIIPQCDFELEPGSEQHLTLYTFGTHTAKHLFCKVCGICSYYIPRSNPDGVSLTLNCVDSGTISGVELRTFDGQNWEESYKSSGIEKLSSPS